VISVAIFVAALTGQSLGSSVQEPSCKIEAFGIFSKSQLLGVRAAPETASGRERLYEVDGPTKQTSVIPARLGLRFGVMHRFANIPEGGVIDLTIRHPPLPTRNGGMTTESKLRKSPDSDGTDFGFDHPHELMPGTWVFDFHLSSRLLCSHTFTVVPEP